MPREYLNYIRLIHSLGITNTSSKGGIVKSIDHSSFSAQQANTAKPIPPCWEWEIKEPKMKIF